MNDNRHPDDTDEQLPCADKLTFSTKDEAQASATVAHYRYAARLKPYICRYCGLWHMASDHSGD
jgi:hypothetical protein